MKLKNMVWSVVGLSVIAASIWWWDVRTSEAGGDARAAAPILDAAIFTEARVLVIDQVEANEHQQTRMERAPDGRWVLPRMFGMPVAEARLAEFRRDLLEGTIVRPVVAEEAVDEKTSVEYSLGLRRLTASDGAGRVIAKVELGREETMFHNYARVSGIPGIVLFRHNALFDGVEENWVERTLAPFAPDEVSGITIVFPEEGRLGDPVNFRRDRPGGRWTSDHEIEGHWLRLKMVPRVVTELAAAGWARRIEATEADAVAWREAPLLRRVELAFFDGGSLTWEVRAISPTRDPSRPDVAVYLQATGARETERKRRAGDATYLYWAIDVVGRWPANPEGFFTNDPAMIEADCVTCD